MNSTVLFTLATQTSLCVCDGNLNFNTRLNADAGDLLDNLRRAVKVNEAFVDPHLKPIPGFGTLTTRSLTGGDAQSLKGGEKPGLQHKTDQHLVKLLQIQTKCNTF